MAAQDHPALVAESCSWARMCADCVQIADDLEEHGAGISQAHVRALLAIAEKALDAANSAAMSTAVPLKDALKAVNYLCGVANSADRTFQILSEAKHRADAALAARCSADDQAAARRRAVKEATDRLSAIAELSVRADVSAHKRAQSAQIKLDEALEAAKAAIEKASAARESARALCATERGELAREVGEATAQRAQAETSPTAHTVAVAVLVPADSLREAEAMGGCVHVESEILHVHSSEG
mmetsp:Transcript_7635/g.18137  ORF Transcript_7635/g.18137 Transcript_7635/m.18137 type:complete len:242 (-) Transcript_7635:386-1111(-)